MVKLKQRRVDLAVAKNLKYQTNPKASEKLDFFHPARVKMWRDGAYERPG